MIQGDHPAEHPHIVEISSEAHLRLDDGTVVDLFTECAVAYRVAVPPGGEVHVLGRREGLARLTVEAQEELILETAKFLAAQGYSAGWL
jgi:hypothetical protein